MIDPSYPFRLKPHWTRLVLDMAMGACEHRPHKLRREKIMRKIGWGWLFAFVGIGMASCGAMAQALEKTKITIAVGGKSLFYYLPLTIAERRGFFKDEGLTTEIVDFPGGARALQAMVGGSADIVSGAYEHTINMQADVRPAPALSNGV